MTQLVIFAPNWLGDAVMALPAIDDVRRGLPGVTVTIAARRLVAPLFELIPGVHTLILERGIGRQADLRALQARSFETALLLPNSFQSALTAWRAGVPQRWGYRTDLRGLLLTKGAAAPLGLHQAAYYQQLVRALGFDNGPSEPRIAVSPETRAAGVAALLAAGWDGRTPIVALAPGAAYGGAKKWPPHSFASLAAGLAEDGVACVLVGSAADAVTGEEVLSSWGPASAGPSPINLIGRTDLSTLAGVLVSCRALVSNDSGAMHLGAAIGVRTTALFGPTNEHATRPLGASHTVLMSAVWCRPCMLRECPLDHACMRGIAVRDALSAARRSL